MAETETAATGTFLSCLQDVTGCSPEWRAYRELRAVFRRSGVRTPDAFDEIAPNR